MLIRVNYQRGKNYDEVMLNPLHITSIVKSFWFDSTSPVSSAFHYYIIISTNGKDDVNKIKLEYKTSEERDMCFNNLITKWEEALKQFCRL